MTIAHPRMQHALHSRNPLLPIALRTGEAELAFATECDEAPLLAVRTLIHGIAGGWIPTPQHLLDDLVHGLVAGMGALELLPAVSEDLLEAVLVDVTGRCHAPQS